jgi:hypothetical protein
MQQTNTHYINGQCVSKQVFTNHINKVSRQRALKKALNTFESFKKENSFLFSNKKGGSVCV